MSKRGKIWLGALGFTVFAWAAMLHAARAADALPALKVLSWVHVFGCPRPASDVILLVQDGQAVKVVHIKLDPLPDADKKKLSDMIGDVNGINIVYKCGNDI